MTADCNPAVRLLLQHGWLLLVVVTCICAVPLMLQSRPLPLTHPTMPAGYRSLMAPWLILGNVPWLIMAIGLETGRVPSLVHYFRQPDAPATVAFQSSIVGIWLILAWWIFLANGAEELARYPCLPVLRAHGVRQIRVLAGLVLLSAGVATIVAIFVSPKLNWACKP
jgi:hypothetical protein